MDECCYAVEPTLIQKFNDKIRLLFNTIKYKFVKPPKTNLILHAENELKVLGYDLNEKEEGPNKWIVENIMELLEVFSKQGHSGFSAPYCIKLFSKLANFEPICPLTGKDDEWVEYSNGKFQNKRCSHVFKENGIAYDIEGKIFRQSNGCCYQNNNSNVNITFPYTPKTEYVDVPDSIKEV